LLGHAQKTLSLSGYGAHPRLEKLGDTLTVVTEVTLSDHHREDFFHFETAICEVDEIMECYLVSAGYDYLLRFLTRGVNHYQQAGLAVRGVTARHEHDRVRSVAGGGQIKQAGYDKAWLALEENLLDAKALAAQFADDAGVERRAFWKSAERVEEPVAQIALIRGDLDRGGEALEIFPAPGEGGMRFSPQVVA
jgi:hypothetical protein